jgi:predicted CXXCH cytochrome family protein
LVIAAIAFFPAQVARASDAPHNASSPVGPDNCQSCHKLHNAPGATLTNQLGNYNLCESCHATQGPNFGFPWVSDDQAVPGAKGHSHRWDANTTSPNHGALPPLTTAMSIRLEGGKLYCSTCHDQHTGAQNGGTQHASFVVGTPNTPLAWDGLSTARVSLDAVAVGAAPMGYLLKVVVAGGAGTAKFQLSNDNGFSWFGWNGSAWVAGDPNGKLTGAAVALNDSNNPANVKVTFTGTMTVGDQWRFYVSYPFLRIPNASSELCEDCHRPWTQTAANVNGTPGGNVPAVVFGTTVFSHPVGEGLANSYDRIGAVLDANGALQTVGDGLKTNDLKLDATNKVRCMTCHYLHQADSNSLTEDAR